VALLIAAQRGDIDPATLEEAQRDFFINQVLVTAENAETLLAATPDPADYSYDAIMADFWATSAGQIPAGVN
jgi:ribose transport system substrate-binding protein